MHDVINPATEQVIATVPSASAEEADEVIARALTVMTTLNRAASEAMLATEAHAATDITGFGLLNIYAARLQVQRDNDFDVYSYVKRQGLAIGLGLIGAVVVCLIDYRKWREYAVLLYAGTALLLGGLFVFGNVTNPHVDEMRDINAREILVLGVLAVLVLAMGLYPKPFTDVMDSSVAELHKHVALTKLN